MTRKVTVIPANQTSVRNTNGLKENKRLRVAAYCRVSTDHEEQENSFENQVAYYTNFINAKPEYVLAGIYADEGISGTGTKKRVDFQRMIRDCEEGKIDLVITKSISRFARNTADCLQYARRLKNLGIPVIFEKEHISTTDTSGELLFTILSSLVQEESHNISSNTTWGIRSNFRKGIPAIHAACVMGYDEGPDRKLVINKEQAKVVKRIYKEFLEGMYITDIARELNEEGVCGLRGKPSWNRTQILRMLQNELYKGDLLMQKTYTADYLTKKMEKNDGRLEQFYVEKNHEAIIAPEEWEAVQQELERRERFKQEHGLKDLGSHGCDSAFMGRVFCARCGSRYCRKWKSGAAGAVAVWGCQNRGGKHGTTCRNDNISEENLRQGFVIAWNSIVQERDRYLPGWQAQMDNGTALQKVRARQMTELTAQGKIAMEIPEHTRMVLERIEVLTETEIRVWFLDETEKTVKGMNK